MKSVDSNLAKRELARREVKRRQEVAKMQPRPLLSDSALKMNLRQQLEGEERHAEIVREIQEQTKTVSQATEKRIDQTEKSIKVQMNALDVATRKHAEALKALKDNHADVVKGLEKALDQVRQANDKTVQAMVSQIAGLVQKLDKETAPATYSFEVDRDENHLIRQIIAKPVKK